MSCPGCGASIPLQKFACARCWRSLPAELRSAIRGAYSARVLAVKAGADADMMRRLAAEHDDAKRAGREWLARTGGQQ